MGKENKIFPSRGETEESVMAGYLWTNYGEGTPFRANGLPLAFLAERGPVAVKNQKGIDFSMRECYLNL